MLLVHDLLLQVQMCMIRRMWARQVLFEGWMLGFRPVGAAAVAEVDADLVPIDTALRGYEAAWDAHVDAWLVIKARAR